MLKLRSSRLTLAALAVAAVIMTAGGFATASNMGFKINKQIFSNAAGLAGKNWVSLPYNNPYTSINNFCTQVGLTSTGFSQAQLVTVNPVAPGSSSTIACGSSVATTTQLIPGRGYQITQPATGNPGSIIIVGSHNPTLSISVPANGAGLAGKVWFAVPYHTTAVTIRDLCLSAGLTTTGFNQAQVVTVNAAPPGSSATVACGSSTATTTTLRLGEFAQLTDPVGPKTFIPAHF